VLENPLVVAGNGQANSTIPAVHLQSLQTGLRGHFPLGFVAFNSEVALALRAAQTLPA